MLTLDAGMPSFARPLVRLPWTFDVERLQWEISRFSDEDWIGHPERFAGNRAMVLVSVGGGRNNDFAISGPMRPTDALRRSPYLTQVVAAFGGPVSRSRLMWLDPGGTVPRHRDTGYHWFRRLRLHVPIHTAPEVTFSCGDDCVHMAGGESWAFDHRRPHSVTNPSPSPRIHLVVDTRGTPELRRCIEQDGTGGAIVVPYSPAADPGLAIEPYRFEVLTPGELSALAGVIRAGARESDRPVVDPILHQAEARWAEIFAAHGHDAAAEPAYYTVVAALRRGLRDLPLDDDAFHAWRVIATMLDTSNDLRRTAAPVRTPARPAPVDAAARWRRRPGASTAGSAALTRIVDAFGSARTFAEAYRQLPPEARPADPAFQSAAAAAVALGLLEEDFSDTVVHSPLFIVSAPRSGSSVLFELLQQGDGLWSTRVETHGAIEQGTGLHPRDRGWTSNRLIAADATAAVRTTLVDRLAGRASSRDGVALRQIPRGQRPGTIRLLDKTPRNALRIPFLRALFPDARFIHLHREPRGSVSSLIEGWRSSRFVTYPDLPDWPYWPWSFLLPPGWRDLRGASLAAIAAHQWSAANSQMAADLDALPRETWTSVEYAELVADPATVVRRLADFAGIPFDAPLKQAVCATPLRLSRFTLLPPDPEKWRKHEHVIAPLLPRLVSAAPVGGGA